MGELIVTRRRRKFFYDTGGERFVEYVKQPGLCRVIDNRS